MLFFKGIRNRFPVFIFIVSFFIVFFILHSILYLDTIVNHIHPKIIYFTAYTSNFVINLFGGNTTLIDGCKLVAKDFVLHVIIDCCAIEPMALFVAVVIAFPAEIKKKISGVLFVTFIFFITNIIRIVSLYFVGIHINKNAMQIVHLDVWQVIFIFISLIMALFWINWVQKIDYKKQNGK